jgi:hypothetical protein
MLTISKEQELALSRAHEKRFVGNLVVYAKKEFPEETGGVPNEDIWDIARLAVEKTQRYGITERADICRFLNFMYILGFNFDEELQWAIEILNNADTRIGATKMLELHEMALSISKNIIL